MPFTVYDTLLNSLKRSKLIKYAKNRQNEVFSFTLFSPSFIFFFLIFHFTVFSLVCLVAQKMEEMKERKTSIAAIVSLLFWFFFFSAFCYFYYAAKRGLEGLRLLLFALSFLNDFFGEGVDVRMILLCYFVKRS